jgi:hypothetical protein
VSEKHVPSIFRVEYAEQDTIVKVGGKRSNWLAENFRSYRKQKRWSLFSLAHRGKEWNRRALTGSPSEPIADMNRSLECSWKAGLKTMFHWNVGWLSKDCNAVRTWNLADSSNHWRHYLSVMHPQRWFRYVLLWQRDQLVRCSGTDWTIGIRLSVGKEMFFEHPDRFWGATKRPSRWLPGPLSPGVKRTRCKAETNPHLVPRSIILNPYLHTSSCRWAW